MSDAPDPDVLMDRAFDLLDRNNPQEALKIGLQLEDMRYSGGFEIQALALWSLRRRKKAIKVLERGVDTVPKVWLLWQLLGNYRSDEGDYDGACVAYEHASGADCDLVSIAYNHANALARAKRWEEAEARLAPVFAEGHLSDVEPTLGLYIVNLQEDILRQNGRDDEVEAFLETHMYLVAKSASPKR